MAWVYVPNIKPIRAKGRVYYYHRVTGERLLGDEAQRAARALEINGGLKPRQQPIEGSVEAAIQLYLRSAEYAQLADGSKVLYRYYLDQIRGWWGLLSIKGIKRSDVLDLRDEFLHKPATANMLVKVVRLLVAFSVDRGLREDPLVRLKSLKAGEGHQQWPQTIIERFLGVAEQDMQVALHLGLYTGQRRGDCLVMGWPDIDGTAVRVRQIKTGELLWIPMHTALRECLADWPRQSPLILPINKNTFVSRWRATILKAKLDGYTFHGLRYTAAAKLAEAGCSTREIGAITGHRSSAMIDKYTRGAEQKRLAESAIAKLERTEQKQKAENSPGKSGKPH